MLKSLSLYIHIPFCSRRCDYCHFYVVTGLEKLISKYVASLKIELDLWAERIKQYQITSIYFGGGTPSLLSGEMVNDILVHCKLKLNLTKHCEISFESNPESLDKLKLKKYLEAGVNRLSLGLQAAQDEQLKSIGRTYTVSQFNQTARMVKMAEVKNLNIDLIFGLPNQTLRNWEESLDVALSHHPQHLACYSLELDHQSVFGQKYRRGQLHPASEELNRKFYQAAKIKLAEAGFEHYEISNWAKPGYKSQHNLSFWQNQNYLGLGAGAHSFFETKTWQNLPVVTTYIQQINQKILPQKEILVTNQKDNLIEAIILNLRLINGINLIEFNKNHHHNLLNNSELWSKLVDQKLVEINSNQIKLTELGQDFYNQVASQIFAQATKPNPT